MHRSSSRPDRQAGREGSGGADLARWGGVGGRAEVSEREARERELRQAVRTMGTTVSKLAAAIKVNGLAEQRRGRGGLASCKRAGCREEDEEGLGGCLTWRPVVAICSGQGMVGEGRSEHGLAAGGARRLPLLGRGLGRARAAGAAARAARPQGATGRGKGRLEVTGWGGALRGAGGCGAWGLTMACGGAAAWGGGA